METDMEGLGNGAGGPNLNDDRFSGVIDTDSSMRNISIADDSKDFQQLQKIESKYLAMEDDHPSKSNFN